MKRTAFFDVVLVGIVVALLLVFTSQAIAQPITVKFSHYGPKKEYEETAIPWAKEIEKRTEGRIKFEMYPFQQLLKAKAHLDGIRTGIADCGCISTPYYPGRFPMMEITFLPFTWHSAVEGAPVLHKLREYDPTRQEFLRNGVKPILIEGSPAYALVTKEPIKKFADMKGKRLRSFGTMLPEVFRFCGAIPTTMPITEAYTALERGVIDGTPIGIGLAYGFHLYEVAPYITVFPRGSFSYAVLPIVWGIKSWNKLPKDIQDIIMEVTDSKRWYAEAVDILERETLNSLESKGLAKTIYLSEEEAAKFEEVSEGIGEWWIEQNKDKGPAKEVYNYYSNLLKQEGLR
jgi:TRAP-type C4-dicarboxylate transport system substrate-binding protein